MRLTLYTDASVHHPSGTVGWGAWAKKDSWLIPWTFGGHMLGSTGDPNVAEALAAEAAVVWLCGHGHLSDVGEVALHLDSPAALALFRDLASGQLMPGAPKILREQKLGKKLRAKAQNAAENVLCCLDSRTLLLKHVRGHSGARSEHGTANAECDRIAYEHMVLARRRKG